MRLIAQNIIVCIQIVQNLLMYIIFQFNVNRDNGIEVYQNISENLITKFLKFSKKKQFAII